LPPGALLRVADALIGTSTAAKTLRQEISRIAGSDAIVWLAGDTGVGKGMVARAIHDSSPRHLRPFASLNCTATPLLEAALFGHERGAFTGAIQDRKGELALVGDGTLQLDEIGDLPLELQPKLLRVLEERRFRPIGAANDVVFRGRILVATHRDLLGMVEAGLFREDLYYRLNVIRLRVPTLAEREGDVVTLLAHFLLKGARPELRLTKCAERWLLGRTFPGNVRELKNLAERIEVRAMENEVGACELEAWADPPRRGAAPTPPRSSRTLDEIEEDAASQKRFLIEQALAETGGNQREAARRLGVHRSRLQREIARLGISPAPNGSRRG
jgi:transcriptional regulator with GAF, ATPase, and Fis domain